LLAGLLSAQGVSVGKTAILRSRFGDGATTLLGEQRLTIGDLAARAALPVQRVESILRGTLDLVTLDDMTIIADVLGTTLFCLLRPVEPAVPIVALEIIEERGTRHA
jgi:hypothetical protein